MPSRTGSGRRPGISAKFAARRPPEEQMARRRVLGEGENFRIGDDLRATLESLFKRVGIQASLYLLLNLRDSAPASRGSLGESSKIFSV